MSQQELAILNRQEGGAQSQITSMCATGGLTQKQSLRGLLLMHQDEDLRVRGLSFCHIDGVIKR